MYNDSLIKNAAVSVLTNLRRTSFSEDGFTCEQVDSIAEAIASAIAEYDRQIHSDEN